MANMTFKASLLPNTDLGYSLGSETEGNIKRWKIYGQITRNGTSKAWNKGRDGVVAGTTTISGYSAAFTVKTTNGSWDIGAYNHTSYINDLVFSYVSDELYNGTNATPPQIKFLENGHIVATLDGSATSLTTSGTTAQFYRGDQTWTSELTDSFFATKAGEVYFKATNTNTSVSVYLDSAGSTNHGIYSNGYYNGSAFQSSGKWIINRCSTGDVQIPLWASKGTSTTPVYFNSSGIPTAGSTYAGGTAVTLNGTSKASSTASFYAPTASGTANTQALLSKGANTAPAWTNISPSITITAGTASATPKINVTVLGQSGTAQSITTASTSVYGCTKLTSSYTSTDSTLAATGASIAAAIGGLDVTAVGGGTGEYISKIQETNGKISATKATTTVSNTWAAGTTAGPTIKTTVNGVAGTAVAIPSASDSASGAVTTGAQTFAGKKTFGYIGLKGKTNANADTRYCDITLYNGAGTQVGEIYYDIGNATNITSGRYTFRQFSPNSTADTSTTGFYENFQLPVVTAGREANATYQILTTKDYTTLDGRYVNITGDTMTGDLTRSRASGGDAAVAILNTDTTLKLRLLIGSGKSNHGLYSNGYVNSSGTFTASNTWIIYRGADMYVHCGTRLYGAVWNDYAEFRETKEKIEPGRCIKEVGNDTLVLSTERLQEGCEIVSDTFGFAIGQSEKCQTPTAASGRVLAYLYEDRKIAKNNIGKPVCSGPNGTVSIMTNEEARNYPWCIIGTISAVPDYDIWIANEYEGDTKEEIKVNGRIWIRIR